MSKTTLFTNWHTMRWVALSIGVFFAALAISNKDALTGFFSAFFLFQAVTNSGCMVAQSCGVPAGTRDADVNNEKESEIEFTEIKN
ncbi:MAG: hypothetical protein WD022_02270 [Balneolaceae bacterium]